LFGRKKEEEEVKSVGGKREEEGEEGGTWLTGIVDVSKRWKGLPSANYSLDTSDVTFPSMLSLSPAEDVSSSTSSPRLEDSNIIKKLERQAMVKQEAVQSSDVDKPAKDKARVKRTDSKSEAPVKARRRRRESNQLREKTPPTSPLGAQESLEGEEGGGVFAFQTDEESKAEAGKEKMEDVTSRKPESHKTLGVSAGLAPLPRIPLLTFGGKTTIDVTPASPQNNEPPEINEALGMGHFYNQGTQTPERFYREMCPSPHEFSSRPQPSVNKATQTPDQFYPPIPTQDVGIDAGQFLEPAASAASGAGVSAAPVQDTPMDEVVLHEEPVRVAVVPLPVTAGIFLTQGLEEEEEENQAKNPPQSPPHAANTSQPNTAPKVPAAPVCRPPPTATTTQPASLHHPHPPSHPPPPATQPPVVQQPQGKQASENAFEAWIETQSAFEEVPGVMVSTPAPVPAAAPPSIDVRSPAATVTVTASMPSPPLNEQKMRAKRRRERRRRPGQGSESSTDTATPPSTPIVKVKDGATPNDLPQPTANGADQGKKKVPPLSVSSCDDPTQSRGGNLQNKGDKSNGVLGGGGGGRSPGGEKKRQEFIRSGQVSDANDEFVLASESIDNNAR
jgi:hypothetical protein